MRLRATAIQRGLRYTGDAHGFSSRHIFFRHAPATVAWIRISKKTVARAPETAFDFLEIREHELENQRQLAAVLVGRKRTRRLRKARFVSLESLRREARRIFHLQLHMPDLRADDQPKYRHQQERKRDTDDHDEQPEAKKRRTERRSHICILMALPRNPTVRGSL